MENLERQQHTQKNPNYIYEMATLPGDPREDMNITLGCDDVCF